MTWSLLFLSLLTYFSCVTSQPTLTQPVSQSGSLGGTVKISCGISSNPNTISWIQQRSGEGPRFVHCDGCSRGEGIPDRFTGTRSGNNGYLTITNLQPEDEADYYCNMWYSSGSVSIFGAGTQLTVTGLPTVSPSVQVFAPSQEEIRSPNPHTVVCLLSGLYPPSFDLQWKCDDKVITSGVETTKATKQGDKYLASSYMKLSTSDYEKYGTFTCQVTHEGKTIVKSVSKSGSC
ncbi:immunoglobulin lambda-1 light chain-like isoform X4 [Crotalus tigris]|uniref:immunoglobulin lambda-1 light chain-like isoform X4 n=1 Tax=Crotalus tigris TaxID=88082 RepID=UPI00192F4ADA|nr:immunoglobulin lambda-1 light chain-like isoform X4 [Crotalus tigris]